MLAKDKMDRINFLARKKREIGLTEAESQEQARLRQEYLEVFRGGMRKHIEGIKVIDKEGNNLTPDKVQAIHKAKGLHQD